MIELERNGPHFRFWGVITDCIDGVYYLFTRDHIELDPADLLTDADTDQTYRVLTPLNPYKGSYRAEILPR